jgi:RNA polymerase sigma factor (sigma-70 family)
MYRIVSNVCYDVLRTRKRRTLPEEIAPAVPPGPPRTERRDDLPWLEPYPDAELPDVATPEATLRLRESVRLAFVHALQSLPERQRAALILHDVLDWSVTDVAEILDTSDAAINSALQRARESVQRPGDGRRGVAQERDGHGGRARSLRARLGDGRLRRSRHDARRGRAPQHAARGSTGSTASSRSRPRSRTPRPGRARHALATSATRRLDSTARRQRSPTSTSMARSVRSASRRSAWMRTEGIDHIVVFVLPE